MSELQIAADRSDHYSGIARSISGISSRMAALATQFSVVAPRTPADEAWIDLLIASAAGMLQAANNLKAIEYAPPAPEPEPEPEVPAE
jgi:hypothetical protein